MSIFILKPAYKDYIWGGTNLVKNFNKDFEGDILAESWELSCHKDGPSIIANGEHQGKTLRDYIEENGKKVLGTNCERFEDFPILVKLIDARDNLSVQVHPSNEYALKNENQYGKTEVWYIVDCKEGAELYYGFKEEVSKDELEKRIKENTLLEVLNAVPVQKGEIYFIEAGTIHAIGKDIIIAEIQQNSNVTYRVFDYGRVGVDGKPRDLHIEKAIDVTDRTVLTKSKIPAPHLSKCEYFTVDKLYLDGITTSKIEGNITEKTFVHFLVIDGKGTITMGNQSLEFIKGDSIFIEAGQGKYTIEGKLEALITTID